MKLYQTLFFNLFMLLICLSSVQAGERGTWVIRFDIDTPEKVHKICAKENQAKFDRYLVQVRGRADSWYESSFVPKAEGLDFDPLAMILEECTDVEVHAWVNVYYLWTGDTPPVDINHPYYNDAWILKDRTGRSVKEYTELEQRQHWIEGVYADPASGGYRAYFTRVVQEIVTRYKVAGVHLDFVRYPGSFFGDGDVASLAKMSRQDLAVFYNQSGDADYLAKRGERLAWDQGRAGNVTSLVRDVRNVLQEVDPNLKLSASVFPDVIEAFLDKGQKWPDWLRLGLLDEVYIMAYFGNKNRVQSQLAETRMIADLFAVKIWAGLGAYIKTSREIREEIRNAESFGVTDICLFSLGDLLKQRRNVAEYLLPGQVSTAAHNTAQSLPPLVSYVIHNDFSGQSNSMEATSTLPEKSLSMRGIFRYVDSHDDFARVEEQYAIMQDVQKQLRAGVSFKSLSLEYSQAGTKRSGGSLPDLKYTDAVDRGQQQLFDLKVGDYSEIIPIYNGYWIFQILQKIGNI